MTAVPFDWSPSATPDPERRAPSWAMNATSATRRTRTRRGVRPRLADALGQRREHVVVRQPVDRLAKAVRERRPERDHDLGRVVAALRGRALLRIAGAPSSPLPRVRGSTTCGSACRSSQRSPWSR